MLRKFLSRQKISWKRIVVTTLIVVFVVLAASIAWLQYIYFDADFILK